MGALPKSVVARKISFPISAVPRRGVLSVVEIAVLTACIVAAVSIANRYAVDIMIRTFLWAGLALAWNIAGGYAGLISFGHAAFFGIGAYTSTILLLNYGVPPWLGMLAGAVLAACASAAVTMVCARLRGPFFILSTLAVGEVTRIAALNWRSLTGGSEGLEDRSGAEFCRYGFQASSAVRCAGFDLHAESVRAVDMVRTNPIWLLLVCDSG